MMGTIAIALLTVVCAVSILEDAWACGLTSRRLLRHGPRDTSALRRSASGAGDVATGKVGMSVEEYLAANGLEPEANAAGGLPILDSLPADLSPQWLFTYFFLPALGVGALSFFTAPLQEKLMTGKDMDVDWSGRSGRIWQIFNSDDPLQVPDAESDMKLGADIRELRKLRSEEAYGPFSDPSAGDREETMRAAKDTTGAPSEGGTGPVESRPAKKQVL